MKDYFQIIKDIGMSDKKYTDANKYGLLKVTIQRSKQTISGFYWVYKYFDKKANKLATLSSIDLVQLRKKVENKGLDWVVTDAKKAAKMYEINREIQNVREPIYQQKMREKSERMRSVQRGAYDTRNKSGVKYVYRTHRKKEKNVYWAYNQRVNVGNGEYTFVSFLSKTLLGLKEKAEKKGLKFIILDEEKYQKSLEMDEV